MVSSIKLLHIVSMMLSSNGSFSPYINRSVMAAYCCFSVANSTSVLKKFFGTAIIQFLALYFRGTSNKERYFIYYSCESKVCISKIYAYNGIS